MQYTGNTSSLIEQEVYSKVLQESFKDMILGMGLFNDMTSMFPTGDQLNVDQIGQATLQDYSENNPIGLSAIDTSRIQLTVDTAKADGFYITDNLREDSYAADRLFSTRVKEEAFAFAKQFEQDLYASCNDVQTPADTNDIGGFAHRKALAATATAQDIVNAIADMKLAFNKANVPQQGRILIVDSTVTRRLEELGTGAVLVSDSPRFEGLLETGFSRNNVFLRNIHGFDVYESNLLPRVASETVDGVAVTNGYVNIAMCVADDDCKPVMGVIRREPTPKYHRNEPETRDEWYASMRYGFATYRPESVYCLLTPPTYS